MALVWSHGKWEILKVNNGEVKTFSYFIPQIDKDSARFNLFVSKKGNFKNINVHRVIGRSKIKEFLMSQMMEKMAIIKRSRFAYSRG